MNIKTLILSALAATVLVGCQKEQLGGNTPNKTGAGHPMSLALNIGEPSIKTKATNNATRADEAILNNAMVYVLDQHGELNVAPVYFASFANGSAATQNVDITITDQATEIFVLANGGNPATTGTIAESIAAAIAAKGDNTVKSVLESVSLDLLNSSDASTQTAATGASTLTQSGQTDNISMNFTNNTATATVRLSFVAARVSIKGVNFFQADFTKPNADANRTAAEIAALTASGFDMGDGTDKTRVVSVSVLNAPQTTYLFPHAETTAENGKTWSEALFTKTSAFYQGLSNWATYQESDPNNASGADAAYFPAASTSSGIATASLTEAITNGAVGSPYFYVWENRDNGIKNSGVTLATIGVAVYYTAAYKADMQAFVDALNATNADAGSSTIIPLSDVLAPDGTVLYYTVVFDDKVNNGANGTTNGTGVNGSGITPPHAAGSKFADYSIKRSVQYLVYANITGSGVINPFEPNLNLVLKLETAGWDAIYPIGN